LQLCSDDEDTDDASSKYKVHEHEQEQEQEQRGGDGDDAMQAQSKLRKLDILLEAEHTRNEYLKYIESVIGNSTDVLMVDSGFQGMTQHNIQKAYGLKFKGRYFIYKGNPFLDDVKGLYHFEESNLRKNLIFFESIFIDKIGSYINIKNGEFINEEYDKSLQYFDEKTQIIEGVKEFINDMLNFNINTNDVLYVYSDMIFHLMCKENYIKNEKLFDIFFHDNYYVRDNIKKIVRQQGYGNTTRLKI
jgi:hypothetical protein